MAINFNTSPYYDDFSEGNNFHQILFKPGAAVQARELTQLQTILQNQISRFGQNIFKDGAIVIPGNSHFNNFYKYVKLTDSYNSITSDDVIVDLVGALVTGQTTGVTAEVINYEVATSTEPPTIYVKYTGSGTNKETAAFSDAELLTFTYGTASTATLQAATSAATGRGVAFSIASGVIFIRGAFVYFEDETIIISKYSETPTISVGFLITESITTSDDNDTLLDPAVGSFNYFAPGSDRYQISLALQSRTFPQADTVDVNYVEISRMENGVMIYQKLISEYNILSDTMARRTFDESGNYTIRPYGIENIEQLRTSNVGIIDGLIDAVNGGNADLMVSVISPGKAYVLGYEVENIKTKYVAVDKARDSVEVVNSTVSTQIGNYIGITGLYSVPDLITLTTANLYNNYTATPGTASGTKVGTARFQALEYVSGQNYTAYLFDVSMSTGYSFERDVKQIYYDNTGFNDFTANIIPTQVALNGTVSTTHNSNAITGIGTDFTADLKAGDFITINGNTISISSVVSKVSAVASANITGNVAGISVTRHSALLTNSTLENDSILLFEFPYSTIKTVDPTNLETSYATKRVYDRTLSGGNVAITAGTNEVFSPFSTTNYIVANKTTGAYASLLTANVTRSGSPTGKTVTFSLGSGYASDDVRIITTVTKTSSAADKKTKTLVQGTTIDFTGNNTATTAVLSLGQADIYAVSNIRMSANAFGTAYLNSNAVDITDRYTVDTGQKTSHYDIGSVVLKPGQPIPTGPVRVDFDYFTHGAGDYFSVSSYNGIDYGNIPSFTSGSKIYQLRDCLDFRPRIDTNDTTFTSPSEFLDQDVDILTDYSYYLPRTDKIVITSKGDVRLVRGVSSFNPKEPAPLQNSMTLFVLAQKPYVFDVKKDVDVTVVDNRRYTMRDIGKIESRVKNLEYYTTLSLLETDTSLFQVKDNLGFDRFKNGFVVDNFTGHRIGNPLDSDYKISMDFTAGILRPQFEQKSYRLKEICTSAAQRTSNNYALSGNIATLTYTSNIFVESNAASRVENINPFSVISYTGDIVLDPPSDVWFDTDRLPEVHIDKEGNYDTLLNSSRAAGTFGTVWGSWQQVFAGSGVIKEERQGTNFTFRETIDTVTNNDVQVSSSVIPKMRSVNIKFTGTGMKPNTRLQAFFENFRVTENTSGVYTTGNDTEQGNVLYNFFVNKGNVYTDSTGTVSGSFFYDATHFNFSTGEKLFRLTDSPTNSADNETQAEAKFSASGQLRSLQNQIISTRNGLLTSESIFDNRQTAVPVSNTPVTVYNPPATTYESPSYEVSNEAVTTTLSTTVTTAVVTAPKPTTIAQAVYGAVVNRPPEQAGVDHWIGNGNIGIIETAMDSISNTSQAYLGSFVKGNTVDTKAITDAIGNGTLYATMGQADWGQFASTFVAIREIAQAAVTRNESGLTDAAKTEEAIDKAAFGTTAAILGSLFIASTADNVGEGGLYATMNDVKLNPDKASNYVGATDQHFTTLVKNNYGQDPLAQTFVVAGNPGVMTGVDIFFFAKDLTAPMYLELRTVVNGSPSQTVVPFSRRVVFPSEITTSDDGSVATYLKFDGLVYLDPGEYAIVLLTNSINYRVWISQIGEDDILTGRKINSQPFVGVLFKSQNASTWEANQNQDLKFRLYRAVFTGGTPATIDFELDIDDYQNVTLSNNPLVFYPSSRVAKVLHPNNGFIDGSTVILKNLDNFTSNIFAATPNAFSLFNFSNVYGVNVATVNNVEFTVSNVKPDSYTIIMPVASNTTSIVRVGGGSVVAYTGGPSSGIFATQDTQYDAIFPAISALKLADTLFSVSAKVTDKGYSIQPTFVKLDGDEATELETTAVLPSYVNIVNNLSSARPLTIRLTLNNTSTNISPIVDMQQLSAVFIKNLINKPTYATENLNVDIVDVAKTSNIFFTNVSTTTGFISLDRPVDIANVASIVKGTTITVSNSSVNSSTFRVLDILDSGANILVYGAVTTAAKGNVITITNGRSFVAEEAATGGSALAKYITRQVDLVNPSTSINLRIDIAKPINADVKIYYKTKLVGESVSLDTKEYIELTGIVGGVIPDSLSGEFIEVAAVVDSLPQFTSVILKIVLLSDDSADIPKCKNLRAIMLA